MIQRKLIVWLGAALLAAISLLYLSFSLPHRNQSIDQNLDASNTLVYKNQFNDPQSFFEGIYKADHSNVVNEQDIRAIIVPHHLVATELIALGIKQIETQDVSKIILLSPDHFNKCPAPLCTIGAEFETNFGTIETQDAPSNFSLVADEPNVFKSEHGIYSILPFIKYYAPDISVIPLVLSPKLNQEQAAQVTGYLSEILDDRSVFIVSTDFSHYLSLDEANEMDEQTWEIIESQNLEQIAELKNPDQSDCPRCLWLLGKIAEEKEFYNPVVISHSNSAIILGDEKVKSTTSYYSIIWPRSHSSVR